jgi:hypothetical protein
MHHCFLFSYGSDAETSRKIIEIQLATKRENHRENSGVTHIVRTSAHKNAYYKKYEISTSYNLFLRNSNGIFNDTNA